jgi:cation-transporting ATPase 13A2
MDNPETSTQSSTGILKTTSAYDASADTDAQFFPTEPRPFVASLPVPSIDPMEDDYDDPDGGIFSGPAVQSVPTSTSTFRMRSRSKGELDRLSRDLTRERERGEEDEDAKSVGGKSRKSSRSRRSKRSKKSIRSRRGSDATSMSEAADDTGDESVTSAPTKSRSSRPASPLLSDEEDDARPSFFQGISDALRGRRPSSARLDSNDSAPSRPRSTHRRSREETDDDAISTRSETDAGEEDDPYGPYGSEDTTSSETTSSSSSQDNGPRRRRGTGFFGMPMPGDALFGESRLEFAREDDESGEDESPYLDGTLGGGRKGSPNAHQFLYIPDEDLPLHFVGLRVSAMKLFFWQIGCVFSVGGLWLLGRWVPSIWLKSVGQPGEFEKASYIVVGVSFLWIMHGSCR